jgi:hypothetical protein
MNAMERFNGILKESEDYSTPYGVNGCKTSGKASLLFLKNQMNIPLYQMRKSDESHGSESLKSYR